MAYEPMPLGNTRSLQELVVALEDELRRVATVLNAVERGHFVETNVAPEKPRNGDIRYADGTNWNPGSGRGLYIYKSTTWVFLG